MTEQNDPPVANVTASEHESDVDEAGSEIETMATDVVSTRSPLELLDVPPEIRVMIYRHLVVVSPQRIDFRTFPVRAALAPLAIFRTSRLIHEEALQVFYGENHFVNFPGATILQVDPFYARFPFPRIAATIQNIHVPVYLGSAWYRDFAIRTFLKLMPELGNPASVRGTLIVDFSHHCRTAGRYPSLLRWFARALGRFGNFRTVELFFRRSFMHKYIVITPRPFDPVQHFKLALEPVLGPAEDLTRAEKTGCASIRSIIAIAREKRTMPTGRICSVDSVWNGMTLRLTPTSPKRQSRGRRAYDRKAPRRWEGVCRVQKTSINKCQTLSCPTACSVRTLR